MLRPDFVRRKLDLIADELVRLQEFGDLPYEELVADELRLAAVERVLERIVVRAIDVNEHLIASLADTPETARSRLSYRDTFLRLAHLGVYDHDFAAAIAPAAGLRNILVHEYNDVDHRILYSALGSSVRQFTDYIRAVQAFLAHPRP